MIIPINIFYFSVPVRAIIPLFTVGLSRLILQEHQTDRIYYCLAVIVAGVALASMTEINFDLIGLVSSLASTMSLSLQNIYSKKVF